MPGTLQNKRSVCVSSRQRFLCPHGSAINLSVSLMIRFGKAMMSGVCRAAGFKCSIMIEAAIQADNIWLWEGADVVDLNIESGHVGESEVDQPWWGWGKSLSGYRSYSKGVVEPFYARKGFEACCAPGKSSEY